MIWLYLQDCTYFTRKEILRWANIKMEIYDFESWCNVADTATFLFCSAQYYAVTLNYSIRRPVPLWGRRPLKSYGVWNFAFRTLLYWESVSGLSKVNHNRHVPNLLFTYYPSKWKSRRYFIIYHGKSIFKTFLDSSTAIGIWLHSSFLLTTPTTQMWSYHMSWLAACQSWR